MRPFLPLAVLTITIGIIFAVSTALHTPKPQMLLANDLKTLTEQAQKGDAGAQLSLAIDYEHGQGVPKDYTESVKWCRKAADQGNPDAQDLLGTYYATGVGVREDYTEAMKWFRRAAAQGNADAQVTLHYLSHGEITQDSDKPHP